MGWRNPKLIGRPTQIVAPHAMVLDDSVTVDGESLAGTYSRGDVIKELNLSQPGILAVSEANQNCVDGWLTLCAGYIQGEFTEGTEPSGTGTALCEEEDDDGMCSNITRLIHFAFIDESSSYADDESLRESDIIAYQAAIQGIPSIYAVCFQPQDGGLGTDGVSPGPPGVPVIPAARPVEASQLLSFFNQARSALGLIEGQEFHLSLSVDTTGSMTFATVQEAVDALVAEASQYPGYCFAQTTGSGQERWILDMANAINDIRNPAP